jgi:hypothetical protein
MTALALCLFGLVTLCIMAIVKFCRKPTRLDLPTRLWRNVFESGHDTEKPRMGKT